MFLPAVPLSMPALSISILLPVALASHAVGEALVDVESYGPCTGSMDDGCVAESDSVHLLQRSAEIHTKQIEPETEQLAEVKRTNAHVAMCKEEGTQSPIDLVPNDAAPGPKDDLRFPDPLKPVINGTCRKGGIVFNSSTAEAEITGCPTQFYVEFPTNGKLKKFYLKRFHYHTPSEHTINGRYFPMEVHHVHEAADGQALVISVMVGVGQLYHAKAAFLRKIQTRMPPVNMREENRSFWDGMSMDLDPYSQFLDLSHGYFYYSGSETTTPCTINTHWLIVPGHVVVSPGTLDTYRHANSASPNDQLLPFGDIVGLGYSATPAPSAKPAAVKWDPPAHGKNRPIQPLKGKDNQDRNIFNISVTANDSDSAIAPHGGVALALSALLVALWH